MEKTQETQRQPCKAVLEVRSPIRLHENKNSPKEKMIEMVKPVLQSDSLSNNRISGVRIQLSCEIGPVDLGSRPF